MCDNQTPVPTQSTWKFQGRLMSPIIISTLYGVCVILSCFGIYFSTTIQMMVPHKLYMIYHIIPHREDMIILVP